MKIALWIIFIAALLFVLFSTGDNTRVKEYVDEIQGAEDSSAVPFYPNTSGKE